MNQTPGSNDASTPASAFLHHRFQVQAAISDLLDTWKGKIGYPKTGAHSRHLTVSLFRLGIRAAAANGVQPDTLVAMFHKALNDELFAMMVEAQQKAADVEAATVREAAASAATDAFKAATAETPVAPDAGAPVDASEPGVPANYADAALADAKAGDADSEGDDKF